MKNSVTVKKNDVTGELYIDVDDIKHLFESSEELHSYTIEMLEDSAIAVEFFDKNGNKIFPKGVVNG